MKALYGHENPPSAQNSVIDRFIEVGLRALELSNNVVLDGLWGRDERSALRQAAADRGAVVEMPSSTATATPRPAPGRSAPRVVAHVR